MKDLDLLKKQLKNDLPTKGVKLIIQSIKEILPEDSPQYNVLINLEVEQKELFIKTLKRIISEEEMQRANADIRDRLLSFIDSLEASDFEKILPNQIFPLIKNIKKDMYFIRFQSKCKFFKNQGVE